MEKRAIYRLDKKEQTEGKTMVFGIRSAEEVFRAGKTFEKLFFQKGAQGLQHLIKEAATHQVPYSIVPIEKLQSLTRKNHQGVVGFVSPIDYEDVHEIVIRRFEEGKHPFVVVLDKITDVRNFGAIARTAECAGVDALVIGTRGAAQVSPDAIKSSSGALQHIAVCRTNNLKETLLNLKAAGLKIVGCTEKSDTELFAQKVDLAGPIAILLGSEEEGISPEYLKLCDLRLRIPMFGKVSSLNVSNAGAIIMYEVIRQRSQAAIVDSYL